MSNPIVTITMEKRRCDEKQSFTRKIAPNTVNNFISLVKKGFYDGLIFQPRHPGIHDPGRRSMLAQAPAAGLLHQG